MSPQTFISIVIVSTVVWGAFALVLVLRILELEEALQKGTGEFVALLTGAIQRWISGIHGSPHTSSNEANQVPSPTSHVGF